MSAALNHGSASRGRNTPLQVIAASGGPGHHGYTGAVSDGSPDVTALLLRWNAGEPGALDALTPVLYGDLRRLARDVLRRESPGHTLSATALVHEAWLRLVDQRRVRFEDRAHFFGVAAHIMRRVLVDHARAKTAQKRGGAQPKLAITDEVALVDGVAEDMIDLDAALTRLAEVDPRKVQVVEMKFFAGMTNQEVATALSVSEPTVERDWKLARAWLIDAMGGPPPA